MSHLYAIKKYQTNQQIKIENFWISKILINQHLHSDPLKKAHRADKIIVYYAYRIDKRELILKRNYNYGIMEIW